MPFEVDGASGGPSFPGPIIIFTRQRSILVVGADSGVSAASMTRSPALNSLTSVTFASGSPRSALFMESSHSNPGLPADGRAFSAYEVAETEISAVPIKAASRMPSPHFAAYRKFEALIVYIPLPLENSKPAARAGLNLASYYVNLKAIFNSLKYARRRWTPGHRQTGFDEAAGFAGLQRFTLARLARPLSGRGVLRRQ